MKKFLIFIVLVAVCMCFATVAVAETNFSDVENHWAYSAIIEFAEQGIVSGYPDGTFRPDDYVKRDEFVKIINGHVENVFPEYSDVKSDNWAYEYIRKSGIQTGEEMFYPRKDINRADAVFFMYQQAEYGDFAALEDYVLPGVILRQIPENKYIPAIKWAYMSGVLVGDNGVDLRLNESITRAETLSLVKKANSFNGEYKQSLSDNISDVFLNEIYERLDLFDSSYSKNEYITNGEICNAAVKIMTYKHSPQFSASESKKTDTKYADALYFVTDGVFEHYNNKEFAESYATGKTAIELLTYAYIYAHGNSMMGEVDNYYPGISSVENIYENMILTYAYEKGILVKFGYDIEQKITKSQLVSILIQLEHVLPSQKSYCNEKERFEKIDFSVSKFTGESKAVPLAGVSTKAYVNSFYGCDVKEGYRFARDYPDVVANIVRDITKIAENNGASVIIRYFPTLIAVSDNETIIRCRVYCENNKYGKTLSDIFGHCEKDDIALKENMAYIIDFSVGAKELYLKLTPVSKVNVKQVIWSE